MAKQFKLAILLSVLMISIIAGSIQLSTATASENTGTTAETPQISTGNIAGSAGSGWKPDIAVQGGSWPGQNERNPSIASYINQATLAVTLWAALEMWDPASSRWVLEVWNSINMGATWQHRIVYSADSGRSFVNPSIAVSPYNGTVFVAVQKTGGGFSNEIVLLVLSPGSPYLGTWYDIDADADDDRSPQLITDYGFGKDMWLFISYERYTNGDNRDLCYGLSQDWGKTWGRWTLRGGAGTPEANDMFTQSDIAYAQGNVYIAFRHSTDYNTPGRIEVTWVSSFGGDWHNATVTPPSNTDASYPTIAGSHHGLGKPTTLWVAYQNDTHSSAYNNDILACWSKDGGNSWSTPETIAHSYNWEENPQLSVDGMGTESTNVPGYFHLVYLTSEDTATRTNGIYYTQVAYDQPSYTPVLDHYSYSEGWSTPQGQIINNNGNATWTNRIPSITTFRRQAGGLWYWVPGVAWTDGRNNPNLDVYFTTLDTFVEVSVYPSSQTVVAGGSLSYMVTVQLLSGTTATATLDLTGSLVQFGGVWGAPFFSPATVTPTGSSLATFKTVNSLSPGTYTINASAIVGGYRCIRPITFTVVAAPTLTLNLNPMTVARGSPLAISGQLTPGMATTINLYYRYPHATGTWKIATYLSTNAAGAYNVVAPVPTSLPTGMFDLVAVWFNPATGAYTISPIKVLTIT